VNAMDMKDLDREIENIRMPSPATAVNKPRIDLVKNAALKMVIVRIVAVLFFLSVVAFAVYALLNLGSSAGTTSNILIVLMLVFILGGALVAVKLWQVDYTGWMMMTVISAAGVLLPAFAAYDHGMMAGTAPIMATSLVTLLLMLYVKNIFSPVKG